MTYFPDPGSLAALLSALESQVSGVIVVDNTPQAESSIDPWINSLPSYRFRLIRMHDNVGIARALNVGIDAAKSSGADMVLLSDQDSLPEPDMVAGLMGAYRELLDQGKRVGAVGPTFTDQHTGHTFPFQVKVPDKLFYGHRHATPASPHIEALTLITSGCLIPVKVIDEVGGMRDDLFIDMVDMEWCLRARARGWQLFGTCKAHMGHSMGEKALRVWYFGWRRETAYPPLRLYYRVRNSVALLRMADVDWRWKVRNAWAALGAIYSQVFYGVQRRQGLAMALRGCWHGLTGQMGPYRSV